MKLHFLNETDAKLNDREKASDQLVTVLLFLK